MPNFPKCYLFMGNASPHYKSKKVIKYFEGNKDTLIPVYLPTASPESLWLWKRYGTWPNKICLSKNIINHLQV